MPNTFPRSLAGRFLIFNQSLRPVRLIDTKPSDYRLEEIRFGESRIGKAIFENGTQITFDVRWDGITCLYSFAYNGVPHCFDTKTDLGEVCTHVDVMSLTPIDLCSSTQFKIN